MAQAFVNRCWICLLACTLMGWWPAQGRATPVRLTDNFTHADVGRQLQVLEDPFGKLGLDDVRAPKAGQTWADHHSDNLNFGYSHSAFWLRGELINQATQQTDWLVGMRYPLLDYLDIYVVWPDGRVQHHASGDRRAFGSRDLDDRHFYFRLKLQAGDKVQLYARVQGQGSLQAPLEISTPQAQMQRAHREQLLLGIYSGALLAMLVYNLLLSISLRDGAHLYYVVYMAMFGMAQFALSGLAFQHLWPNKPNWGNEATPVFMGLAGWSLLLFSRNFLQLKRHAHRTDKVMQVLQWLFLAAVPATFVMPYAWPIKVVTTATFVVPAVWLLITARLLQQGVQQARYFLAAFGGLLLGSMLTSLHMFGLVPGNVLTEYGLQIGSLLEFTLLSFALAHRLKLAQDDNAQLQRAHAAELESRVQARTHDLDQAMGELTEANQRLHELSELDALTGLKNRMFLSERLPEMWRQAQRWHTPIAVLMIDADHFKKVNDEHGHLAGDEGLRQIASVIKRVVQRPGDHAVRFGGEEFLVVLPQTHTVGAAHIAESIRLGVQSMGFQFEGKPVPLTVSIGVASVVPSAELQPQALLNAADQLLYKAKQSGRNRCALLPDALATLPRKQVTPAAQPNPVSSE